VRRLFLLASKEQPAGELNAVAADSSFVTSPLEDEGRRAPSGFSPELPSLRSPELSLERRTPRRQVIETQSVKPEERGSLSPPFLLGNVKKRQETSTDSGSDNSLIATLQVKANPKPIPAATDHQRKRTTTCGGLCYWTRLLSLLLLAFLLCLRKRSSGSGSQDDVFWNEIF
jgi:hypothetical protein